MWLIKGRVRVDSCTKKLVHRIRRHDIAVIDHRDLDELAAISLAKAGVRAVINAQPSITGRYPNLGPLTLVRAGIPLLDSPGSEVMMLQDGDVIEIRGEDIFSGERWLGRGQWQTLPVILALMEKGKASW